MKVSHLWADLASDQRVIANEVVHTIVGRYWQSVQAGMVYTFLEWIGEQPEIDAATHREMMRLLKEAPVRCLGCEHECSGEDLLGSSQKDDLRCPSCGSTSLKRDRGASSSTLWMPGQKVPSSNASAPKSTPQAKPLPVAPVEGWGESNPGRPKLPEVPTASRKRELSDTKRQRLDQVTTRRMPAPASAMSSIKKTASVPPSSGPSQIGETEQIRGFGRVGNWNLEQVIGQGGIGVVFRASHCKIKRLAAIKVMKNPTESLRKRFAREAQVYADLDHPNIVRLYDCGEEHGKPYLVIEWVDGLSLLRHVEKHGPFSLSDVLEIAVQACDVLQYAHGLGIIHRDVKPDNLLLTSQGKLKVTDFGIAHVEDSKLTMQGAFLGTPDYMAPEQYKQESISPAADWYGLGATLYFLLTATAPFAQSNRVKSNTFKLLMEKATTAFPKARDKRKGVPIALDELLTRMCAVEPRERPEPESIRATLELLASDYRA